MPSDSVKPVAGHGGPCPDQLAMSQQGKNHMPKEHRSKHEDKNIKKTDSNRWSAETKRSKRS